LKKLYTKNAPEPIGPYLQGIEMGGFIFLSGQIALKPDTGELVEGLAPQTHQVIRNIEAILDASGCTLANVVKATVYLRRMKDFAEFNQVYAGYFKENPPARTTVEVSALPKDALIEIDIIARK
jgi:2-iminobutanoate/2-iminopropanoate deaminase